MCIPFIKVKKSVIIENGEYFPLSQEFDPNEYKTEKDYERQEKVIYDMKEEKTNHEKLLEEYHNQIDLSLTKIEEKIEVINQNEIISFGLKLIKNDE